MRKIIFLANLLTLSFCQIQAQKVQPLITGGFPINITEAPWQALLRIGVDRDNCGGAIIAPNFILTAKHCVQPFVNSPSAVRVIVGTTCRSQFQGQNVFNVSRIILHPDPNVDAALLQLSRDITFNNSIRPINYWDAINNSFYDVGNQVRVSGWGLTIPGVVTQPDCLQAVDVNIISNQDATNMLAAFGYRALRAHEMATTGTGDIREGACHNDSGGPLVIRTATNEPVVIGIVAWGRRDCPGDNTNSPTVYVRVSHVLDWINENICFDSITNQDITSDRIITACDSSMDIGNITVTDGATLTIDAPGGVIITGPILLGEGSGITLE